MSDFEAFFNIEKTSRNSHPLIRLLETYQGDQEFREAKVKVLRNHTALGFEPAQLSLLFFNKQGKMVNDKTEPWDAELNNNLIDRQIRALDDSNEIMRFELSLSTAFDHPETRYGDGFFNAVLMLVVDHSPFAKMDAVRNLRLHISTNKPLDRGPYVEDCRIMIQKALQDRWFELRKKLGYDQSHAEQILSEALAAYLDERFGISISRKLGWLNAT